MQADGLGGHVAHEGSLLVEANSVVRGALSLATNTGRTRDVVLKNVTSGLNYTAVVSHPPDVTVNGSVHVARSLRIDGSLATSTWCALAPLRPNTTNITEHLLLGFSNNTNESFPMPPCNHSLTLGGEFRALGSLVGPSTSPAFSSFAAPPLAFSTFPSAVFPPQPALACAPRFTLHPIPSEPRGRALLTRRAHAT